MAEPTDPIGPWLAAARGGSREALGKALETCRRYLLLIAGQQFDSDLQAKGGASDLVQETFLEAQRDFAQFHGTTEVELLAWLRQILLNNAGHFTRRFRGTGKRDVSREVGLGGDGSSAGPGPGLAESDLSPSGHAVEREQALALQQALARLPEDYARVLTLRFQQGLSFEEIGQRIGRSPDAARKLWSRALDQLREEWEGTS
jgi:RNA polymerase sigma-70 factor (ECF subfamily)